MTLPTTGSLSLADIQTEFGGVNPISMNEYYAGGTYVASGTSGTNGAVPSSGQISFAQFYGTSSTVVDFVNETLSSDTILPDPALVTYTIYANGSVTLVDDSGSSSYNWVTPTSSASQFEYFATLSSGAITTGTTGTWLAATSNNEWTASQATSGTTEGTLTFQVRKTGNVTILDTWTVNLYAHAGN